MAMVSVGKEEIRGRSSRPLSGADGMEGVMPLGQAGTRDFFASSIRIRPSILELKTKKRIVTA